MALYPGIPDEFAQLVGAPPQMPPPASALPLSKRRAPVLPVQQPQASAIPPDASGQDAIRNLMAPAAPQQPAPPQPSDDPSLTMPELPKPPQLVAPGTETLKQIQAVPRPDPNKLKPRWWERTLGGLSAGLAAYGHNPNAYEIGANVTNRRYTGAMQNYQAQVGPLENILANERQMGSTQNDLAEKNFNNQMSAAREGREQVAAGGKIKRYEDLSSKFVAGTEQEDPNSPTGWTAETFGGERKPFTQPKSKQTATPHTVETGNGVFQFNPDTNRYDIKVGPPKKSEADKRDPNRGTPAQFAGSETKKAAALAKAEREYRTTISNLGANDTQGRKEAADALEAAKQEAQNAYEAENAALGGEPKHFEYGSDGKSTAPATTTNGGGKQLTDKTLAAEYLRRANGDKNKARELAKKDNWKF